MKQAAILYVSTLFALVAIGVLDYHKNEGGVYYQAPGQKNKEVKEDGISFRQMEEEEML